jgi:hypothetical protein
MIYLETWNMSFVCVGQQDKTMLILLLICYMYLDNEINCVEFYNADI